MARARTTTSNRRPQRERWRIAGVVVLAAVSGLVAAHFGTRRAWENAPVPTSPVVEQPRNP